MEDLKQITDQVATYATQFGYTVERHASGLSDSAYLELSGPAALKIRISDHVLPPTYGLLNGFADIEIDATGDNPEGTWWPRAVAHLAKRAGVAVPDDIARLIAEHEAEIAAARRAASEREAARMDAAQSVDQIMKARGLDGLTGRAKKRARQKIRFELGLRDRNAT